VYAYVVMRNHYHLAIETPKANLVDGMHWLQGTLATRFNRFRNERGHLFQGRYQAILLEDFPGHESGFAVLSRGWAIGTLGWRKALAQDYSHQALSPGLEAEQLWVRAEAAEASQRSIGEEIAGRC